MLVVTKDPLHCKVAGTASDVGLYKDPLHCKVAGTASVLVFTKDPHHGKVAGTASGAGIYNRPSCISLSFGSCLLIPVVSQHWLMLVKVKWYV